MGRVVAVTDLVERFCDAFGRNQGAWHRPGTATGAVETVCERVVDLARGEAVAVPATDALLDRLGVLPALLDAGCALVGPDHPGWREAVATCAVGVTGSLAGVAETGTVAVGHGPGSPRAVSLAPDHHVCVVAASTIAERFEDAFEVATAGGLPPNLVWISGPSRSADIEKRITLGVHGPRHVEVVIVDV